ncbi:hypothetical protein COB72_07410 [bacterium]|nr:MAG: hypothetical protein COB72_07410 [bacterium]
MKKITTRSISCALFVLAGIFTQSAHAQSLFLAQEETNASPDADQPEIVLEEASLYFITAPEDRVIQKHDIITIIIDESSSQKSSQTLETEKESKSDATVSAMLDVMELLQLRIRETSSPTTDLIKFNAKREFSGEGEYERTDKFTARIAARVLEVKPNGTLVLEAVKRIAKDSEISVLTLSGFARDEDVTAQNTILSSQLADLNISVVNEGDLKKAAEKGLITRVLDSIFSF